jgi:hypothetical protein
MAVANSINEQTTGICGFTGTAFTATSVTNHNIILGGSTTSTLTNVAPSATSCIPVISQGSSADPAFGTAVVAGGGTGQVTLTNHGVLVGAATAAITQLAAGSAGQVLQSGGASADPAYSTATYPATSTINQILYSSAANTIGGISTVNNGVLITSSSGVPSILADGTTGQILTATTGSPPSWISPATSGTVTSVSGTANQVAVATGTTTPVISLIGPYTPATYTAHGILIGEGTNSIVATAAGSAGQVLQSGGASADPTYSTSTFPSTATSTGSILRADGTNWVATTATYPNTTSANQILFSSAANTISQITTAANSILLTDASSVPSLGTSLINDFTYTSSTAGTVRTLKVTNTDNSNTSSGALIKAVSGGASAGDAVFQASTTTTVWSFGVDNSVTSPTADPFVIAQGTALGTNNVMSVDTAGAINYPLQPAFLAVANTQNSVTGDSTTYTILYANEIFDQGSNFSSPNFTAPVTGRYQFNISTEVSGLGVANTSGSINIVATSRTVSTSSYNWGVVMNVNTAVRVCGSVLIDMTAADTCKVTIAINSGTKAVGVLATNTTFSGFLVC